MGMVRDAEENQAADAERKLEIEAKNTELKEALEVDEPSAETIKEKTAELQTTAQKIGEEMRKKSDAAEGEANKENVQEAEFKEKADSDKEKEKESEKKEGGGKA